MHAPPPRWLLLSLLHTPATVTHRLRCGCQYTSPKRTRVRCASSAALIIRVEARRRDEASGVRVVL